MRRPQPQHGGVEARPAHGARADELVVLLVDPVASARGSARRSARRRRGASARCARPRSAGTRPSGTRPGSRRRARRRRSARSSPCRVTSPITAWCELPALADLLDRLERTLGRDDRDHPLLALGDHDLPRLEVGLAERHAVEVDVDAGAVARHLGERRGEPGGAAVLQRLDEAALDELDARPRSACLPVNGSPTCTDGRFSSAPSPSSWLASTLRAADPVAAGRRAEEDESVARAPRACARVTRSAGSSPTHIALTRQLSRVRLVEDGLAADGRDADRSCRSGRCRRRRGRNASSGAPKRSPSSSAIGRAPIATMSRRIPPTPVAAPWNGSTADGWLWLSTLNATASPSPRSITPAFSPGPCSTRSPARRQPRAAAAPSACSRSAPTRAARRPRARSGSGRGRAARGFARSSPSVSPRARWSGCSATASEAEQPSRRDRRLRIVTRRVVGRCPFG